MAQIKKHYVVASSNNFPPVNFLSREGELVGFARELSTAVAQAVGIELEYRHSPNWVQVLDWLKTGRADFIHDAGYTAERSEFLDFSAPILSMREAVFTRTDRFDIYTRDSLHGKLVACVNKHVTHLYIETLPDTSCYLVNTPAEAAIALINGDVDAFVYPEQIAVSLIRNLDMQHKVKLTGVYLRTLDWSMVVRKGDTSTLALLDKGLATVKENGIYQKIYDRWFGQELLQHHSNEELVEASLLAAVLSGIGVLLVAVYFYVRRMRVINNSLQESELKYRNLVDQLPQRVFFKDVNLVYRSCNRSFAEDLGRTVSEVTGKTDQDLFPEFADQYFKDDMAVLNRGEALEYEETRYIRGRLMPVLTLKSPVYDRNKELSGLLGIILDVSENLRLRELLSSFMNEYNVITDRVPNILYKVDMEGNLVWWNRTFCEAIGYDKGDFGNVQLLDVIVASDRAAVAAAIQKVFAMGMAEVEAQVKTVSGELMYSLNGAALYDDNGEMVGLVGVGADISRQKQEETDRQHLQKQLLQAQKMEAIGQLTGGIAHDFNNILSSVLGYAELSIYELGSGNTDKLQSYLKEVQIAGGRARDLVAQMLTFSRGNKVAKSRLNVNLLMKELSRLLRPTLTSSIQLNLNLQDDLPEIEGEPVQLEQMVMNLCINARDAMGGEGVLNLGVQQVADFSGSCSSCHERFRGAYLKISVQDNGSGISEADMARIFDPFMTTKEAGKGSGMGLAMVHGITHNHGGHIVVQSSAAGTTFSLYVPYILYDGSGAHEGDEHFDIAPVYDEIPHHILVVDDEHAIADLHKNILEHYGFNVTALCDSARALALFKRNPENFSLLLTDHIMPDMTGKNMAYEMTRIRPDLPVIMCTGFSDVVSEHQAQEFGISKLLQKPVESKVLVQAIYSLLKVQGRSSRKIMEI